MYSLGTVVRGSNRGANYEPEVVGTSVLKRLDLSKVDVLKIVSLITERLYRIIELKMTNIRILVIVWLHDESHYLKPAVKNVISFLILAKLEQRVAVNELQARVQTSLGRVLSKIIVQ